MVIERSKVILTNIVVFLAGMATATFFTKIFKWGLVFVVLAIILVAGYWWVRRITRNRGTVEETK